MNVTMKLHDRDCKLVEVDLPGRYEVCPRCEGRGSIVNPSVDGNGLDANAFAEDPDFKEAYFSGVYDIHCPECHGQKVVAVADIPRCTFSQKRLLVSERYWQLDEIAYRNEIKRELWACGGG